MSWTAVTGVPFQYQKADGALASDYYLKFYEAGTTTPLPMATDSTGGTTLAKCKINSSGYPVNGSDAEFIPHISKSYKIVLYKNATDADANTTGNADLVIDNVKQTQTGDTDVWNLFSGTATQTGVTTFTLTGDQRNTFSVGTKLKLNDASTIYGIVTAVAYTSLTTITVLATADLTGSLSTVEYAATTDDGQTKGLSLDARTYVVTASRTITNDFKIPKGGMINISSSQTLTISGSIDAGLYQIFTGGGVVAGFDAAEYYGEWWGAAPDGELTTYTGTDNYTPFQALCDFLETRGSGVWVLQPKIYMFKRTIRLEASNVTVMGYGATLFHNGHTAADPVLYYRNDGLRVGKKALEPGKDEDASNPELAPWVKVYNTHVKGLTFRNVRIGLWFVHCYNCTSEDISSDGAATVATGNDGADDCDQMIMRNTYQMSWQSVQAGYSGFYPKSNDIFYTIGTFQTNDFLIDGVTNSSDNCAHPGGSFNVQHITISNSERGIVKNAILDCVDKVYRAIDCTQQSFDVTIRDCIVRRASVGIIMFNTPINEENNILDNTIIDCATGINISTSKHVIKGNRTKDCTTDLYLATDASRCIIHNNVFEGDVVSEQSANGLALHSWSGNIGGPTGFNMAGINTVFPYSVRNVEANYLGAENNVTGNGTYYTLKSWTNETDTSSLFDASTGVFTLPSVGIGGTFTFEVACAMDGIGTASEVRLILNLNGGAERISLDYTNQGETRRQMSGSVTRYLGNSATAQVEVYANGIGADTADVLAGLGYISITEQRT